TSHAIEASELQGLARDWTGVEAFAGRVESCLVGGVCGRWVREQALEVGEYQVCLAQRFGHPPERDRRIGHRLQVDLTGEDHRLTHRCLLHEVAAVLEQKTTILWMRKSRLLSFVHLLRESLDSRTASRLTQVRDIAYLRQAA